MDIKIDKLIKLSGNQNRYQYFALWIIFLSWVNTCILSVSIPFFEKAPRISYFDEFRKIQYTSLNYTICNWEKNYTIVEHYHYSWVSEFGIYCDPIKTGFIGSFTFFGNMWGALLFPVISKMFPHKKIILFSMIGFIFTLNACTLLNSYWFIMGMVTFIAMFGMFSSYSSIVLVVEIVSSSKRSVFGGIVNIGFTFCGITYVVLYWYIGHWKMVFYICSSLTFLICIIITTCLYDSPRRFIDKGDIKKTIAILRGIAKFNNKLDHFSEKIEQEEYEIIISEIKAKSGTGLLPPDERFSKVSDNKTTDLNYTNSIDETKEIRHSNTKQKGKIGPFSLIKYPSIRYKFLVWSFLWFSTAAIYYGISIGSKNLPGTIYQNLVILYFGEACSYFLTGIWINVKCLGRKKTLCAMYLMSATSLLGLVICKPFFSLPIQFSLMWIARFCISGVFTAFYAVSLENYPTPVRTIGFGINATCGNIGGVIIPMVIEIVDERIVYLIFGGLMVLQAFLWMLVLEETVGKPMRETIKELE